MLICRQQLRRKNVLSQVGKETLQLAGEDYIEVNFLNTHCVYLLDLVAASVVAIVKGVAYRAAPSVVPSVHVYTIHPNGWFAKWDADKYYYALIYTQNDQVVSVYDTTDGRKLVYECEAEKQPAPALDEGSILLTDGVLGEYGKEVTIPSQTYGEYTYIWYVVPYGKYEVVNNSRLATVFVVSDKDSNDVRCTLQFQSSGETGEIVVEEGTHIELSMNAEVILTEK